MNNINNINELIDLLTERRFWIFGTGFVADIFWQGLVSYGLCSNVEGFIVSKKDMDFFCGLNIIGVDEGGGVGSDLICIAVHEANKNEVVEMLGSKGMDNYIFVYPFLWDLKLGVPQKRNIKIEVRELIKCNLLDYKLVVRYLALEQYFGKNKVGYDLYIKAFENYANKVTAMKRLNTYIDFISKWKTEKQIFKDNIKINNSKRIIDGHHRVVLAKFFGLNVLNCDIYDTEDLVQDICGKNAAMTEDVVMQIYDMEEIEILERCKAMLLLESD